MDTFWIEFQSYQIEIDCGGEPFNSSEATGTDFDGFD